MLCECIDLGNLVAVDLSSDAMYQLAAAVDGYLYVSTDVGKTWKSS